MHVGRGGGREGPFRKLSNTVFATGSALAKFIILIHLLETVGNSVLNLQFLFWTAPLYQWIQNILY